MIIFQHLFPNKAIDPGILGSNILFVPSDVIEIFMIGNKYFFQMRMWLIHQSENSKILGLFVYRNIYCLIILYNSAKLEQKRHSV